MNDKIFNKAKKKKHRNNEVKSFVAFVLIV